MIIDGVSTLQHNGYLCFSVNSRYSSLGFMLFITLSMRFCISLNLSDVRSPCWLVSCSIFFHSSMKLSCTDCWCSNRPGSNTVRKSFSTSTASVMESTYSLWVRCSLRQAFWYLSRTSSNFRPPRPAINECRIIECLLPKIKIIWLSRFKCIIN